jgi:hypothetical protein
MTLDRRQFVSAFVLSGAAVALPGAATENDSKKHSETAVTESKAAKNGQEIDFRFAPHHSQSTMCFPDDPRKSVVGQAGDLRYGFANALLVGMEDFHTVVEFSLAGFPDDRVVRQWVESPSTPIVHTLIERPTATMELTAFASRHADEGRVDNVLISILAKKGAVAVAPKIRIRTCDKLELADYNSPIASVRGPATKAFLVGGQIGNSRGTCVWWEEAGFTLYLPYGEATVDKPAQYLVRVPQEGQPAADLVAGIQNPETLLRETREFWRGWKPFGSTDWSYPERHGEFLTACARNIQQAREMKDGRLVFQVGPTVYRGMWIVDGNFLLEAARYLGYDKEADEGLKAEWSKQLESGQVSASAGGEHWKDTAIAMYTLVRQCELKQDWSLFRELEPNIRRAIDFLVGLRDKAKKGASTNGRYGLLAPGFADGGLGGVRSEFTNTVWSLAGLRAVAGAAKVLNIPALQKANDFYRELYTSFQAMTKQEMVRHPEGFEYLPMIAHDDALVNDPDPWNRPRPQTAQWALSHAIYPGVVFEKNDPVVRGHIALLQSCTREDVPIETGWLWHEALWNYNASFAAHVYLWAGLRDWAQRTFTGFLNHASPLYCWREEQPLQEALLGQDWGDMPHNWASAECVRYLRHMLALEDGSALRLLEGVTELKPYRLQNSPTRFGRIDLQLEPAGRHQWHVRFERAEGPTPTSVRLPAQIGMHKVQVHGASIKTSPTSIEIDPGVRRWEALLGDSQKA